ncbi:hypothetical protein L6164_036802 [Bauhinia variegata]|uniref:Uncharacterized protein n=1 Tax=Bauhinia variegata TaxID=167791 RepID=A0ACB9KI59_BAUVA|nr:hypothetical protein L6164_036802 [Bauhinia variegata]
MKEPLSFCSRHLLEVAVMDNVFFNYENLIILRHACVASQASFADRFHFQSTDSDGRDKNKKGPDERNSLRIFPNIRPKVYLLGDSITEQSFTEGGWSASLANRFALTVDVVLRGNGGYNTRWTLKVLDTLFPATGSFDNGENSSGRPIFVTVFFGANDACLPDRCSAYQHVPLDEYKQNLYSIVSFFKKKWPETRVILITPPPIDEEARLKYPYIENPQGLPERTNEAAAEDARACISVAGECGIPVVDLWTKMQRNPDWAKVYPSDGLHLTKDGQGIVFEELILKLEDELGLHLEALPIDVPRITEIDPNDPMKAFEKF